jgi:signal peptidase II
MRVEEGPRQPQHQRRDLLLWAGLTCMLVILDQVSKLAVRSTLTPGSIIPLLGDVLRVTFIPNYRGFSWFVPVLPDWVKPLFLLLRVSIFSLVFPAYQFYKRYGRATGWAWVASIGISAGTIGNVVDDLLLPYTTDFIQVFRSPSANLADLCSFVGVLALLVEVALWWRRAKPRWRGFRHFWTLATQTRREFLGFLWHYFGRKP